MFKNITIPNSPWIWVALLLLAFSIGLSFWAYRRAWKVGKYPKVTFYLRLLAILIIAICLIEPMLSGQSSKSGENLFVILTDNSQSMLIKGNGQQTSKGQSFLEELTNENKSWQNKLAEHFQVRRYAFDSRLHRIEDFSEIDFGGQASALGSALRTISDRYRNQPLAGVLLFTDGIATDQVDAIMDSLGPIPVFPVVTGDEEPQQDIAIEKVSVSQTSFEDAPVTIRTNVQVMGFAGKSVVVDLLYCDGKKVKSQTHQIKEDHQNLSLRFRVKPKNNGVLFYQIQAREQQNNQPQTESPTTSEATALNNNRIFVVDRGSGPYRILYVSGRPNWEYKFLKRSIESDLQLELVGLIRIAKREPKFDFRGRTGETNNPLFRGFDSNNEKELEDYDQPVLMRLNTRDQQELSDGFPKTRDQLYGYHAVILDDVDASFFSQSQMELLRRFVADRGGGFLMLGGLESFRQGKYDRTPIGQILPVYLDQQPEVTDKLQVRLSLTRQGWLMPWARLRDTQNEELDRLSKMPLFKVLNRVHNIKPGASLVTMANDNRSQQYPALAVQRFGNGRVAALTIGDLWRWGMKMPESRQDMEKFWRQLLRWLVADVPDRISIQTERKGDQATQTVILNVHARDENFEAMDNVNVSIEITQTDGQTIHLIAEPSLTQPGLYQATYIPRHTGGYHALTRITSEDNANLGQAQIGWALNLEAQEFQSIKTNLPLLERLANESTGQIVKLNELNKFVRTLPKRNAPVMQAWTKPIWDLPGILFLIFFIVLMCFLTEWFLRRWRGLP